MFGETVMQGAVETESFDHLPRYQCHKQVRALKIRAIGWTGEKGELVPRLLPDDETLLSIGVSREWYDKHKPVAPGYFVVYNDGYQSWSPVEAFESGYARIDDRQARCQLLIDQIKDDFINRPGGIVSGSVHPAICELVNAFHRAEQLTRP